ncbi:glycosyltransferase [Thalassospira sp. MIT121401]|uniref:glycosyltransferase n=1 Tax=Thalassospira sp. MIT121401 TaxID=3096989 RepID=UPI00399A61F1
MKKVLFVTGSLQIGGAEKHLLALLPKLVERGFDVRLYVFDKYGPLSTGFAKYGIKCVGIKKPRKGWPTGRLGRFVRIFHTAFDLIKAYWIFRPDIVHFFLPHAYVLGGLTSLLYPNVVRIMSRRSLNRYHSKHPFLSKIERRLHQKMDAVMANSNSIVQELIDEGVPKDKLELCYNGVILSSAEDLIDRSEFRQSLGVAERSLVFVMIANLIPYKGHSDLLKAFSLCREQLPEEWNLILVGRDDGIGQLLIEQCNDLGIADNVILTGEQANVSDFLSISDVGLLSSHEEGFSNSILEVMYAGIPIIATDVGGNQEIVQNGRHGYIVPPSAPDQLAQAILKLSGSSVLRQEFGRAARQHILEHFSMSSCADCYAKIYHSNLAKH